MDSGSYADSEGQLKAAQGMDIHLPCPRTNWRDVFSAKSIRVSPAGFLSFMSPSFSVRCGMQSATDDLPKDGQCSARMFRMPYNLADT